MGFKRSPAGVRLILLRYRLNRLTPKVFSGWNAGTYRSLRQIEIFRRVTKMAGFFNLKKVLSSSVSMVVVRQVWFNDCDDQ